jgi:hypothetical protein
VTFAGSTTLFKFLTLLIAQLNNLSFPHRAK